MSWKDIRNCEQRVLFARLHLLELYWQKKRDRGVIASREYKKVSRRARRRQAKYEIALQLDDYNDE